MSGKRITTVAMALLFGAMVLVGCSGGGGEKADATSTPAAETSPPATEMTDATSAGTRVEQAVLVARAIEAAPDQAEAILQQHGLTLAEFETMLYDIAENPEEAAAYAHAMTAP